MRLRTILPLLAVSAAYAISTETPRRIRNYDAHDYYVVELPAHISPQAAAEDLGLHYDGPLAIGGDDHHIFRSDEVQHGYDHIKAVKEDLKRRRRKRELGADKEHVLDHKILTQKQELHKRFPLVKRGAIPVPPELLGRANFQAELDAVPELLEENKKIALNLSINDPIFLEQWHLYNHVEPGHHINVSGVWEQGITGKGSTVCIVDDGLDLDSDDLKDNYCAECSWDYNDPGPDPKPRLVDDRHGTRCAGEVAAVRNDVCGVGVAYDARVGGVRILSKIISDADEAEAMTYANQQTQIYSCSWGPPDDGKAMEAPGILIRRAMLKGIQQGRAGLGSIFVFAIGNGAAADDNCNFDGYTNSIYSVSVGGIDRKGLHPYYSEKCSAQLVVTYSSGSGDAIHTTDVGQNSCYNNHGGTSAAGPLVAGIYALMLEVNPKLTWRDIQWLTVLTAVKLEDQPSDYQMNKAMNKDFSHQFGYGKADAWAMVEAAKTWESVKRQAWFYSPWQHVNHDIPQGDQGLASTFDVTEDMLKEANLFRIEHVTITMNVEHTRRGDLSVELKSPTGMVSHLSTARRSDEANAGYVDWTFMSVAHWGESGVGTWAVIVKDTKVNEHSGKFTDWHMKLWGEAIDGENQPLLPLPTDHDDDDHDMVIPTQTATVHTTTVAVPTETGTPPGNPEDHPERPVKPTATPTFEAIPPIPTPDKGDDKEEDLSDVMPPTTTDTSSLLPHPFPTFGVSKKTQTWIYGSIALILIFLAGLFSWMLWQKRKKQRWGRTDYDFEMVDRDDADESAPLASNGYANGGTGKRKKRGNDLYNAFAEGSDDEADAFELGSDEEDDEVESPSEGSSRDAGRGEMTGRHERYRDEEPKKEGLNVD
ncbi:Kexin [Pseudocercospora fuligena]|uniref:Kexin n=1 Tax=Pseudocercospora fuligena TaxID=685502 RepID=A0A8H6R9D4_9PEZI|nr:Kexin [Pseudocercospora fuligena]